MTSDAARELRHALGELPILATRNQWGAEELAKGKVKEATLAGEAGDRPQTLLDHYGPEELGGGMSADDYM